MILRIRIHTRARHAKGVDSARATADGDESSFPDPRAGLRARIRFIKFGSL